MIGLRSGRMGVLVLGAAAALATSGPAVRAAPLDDQACAQLKDEQAQLVKAGAKADLDRGADWAKANLATDRLRQVERYITVEEQLLFRCPQPKPPRQTASEGSTGKPKPKRPRHRSGTEDEAAEARDAAPQSAKPAPAKAPVVKADPKPTQATAKTAATKPKPKVNDAYTPPPRYLPEQTEAQ